MSTVQLLNLRTLTLALALLTGAGACQFRKEDVKGGSAEVERALRQWDEADRNDMRAAGLSAEKVSIRFEGDPEPNRYHLVATWAADIPFVEVLVNGVSAGEIRGGRFSRIYDGPDDVEVILKSKNTAGRVVARAIARLERPKDLVITDGTSLNKPDLWRYERIFFMPKATLVLNGYSLNLAAGEIIFDETRIVSSPVRRAYANDEERENSTLILNGRKIRGSAFIDLSGFDGPPGRNAAPGRIAENGHEGGYSGHVSLSTEDYSRAQIEIHLKPGRGGAGGKGMPYGPPAERADGADGPAGRASYAVLPKGPDVPLHFKVVTDEK